MSTSIAAFFRGDTKKYTIALSSSNLPVSVHNSVLTFTMKKTITASDTDALIQVREVIKEPDPENPKGIMTITIPASLTTTLSPGVYPYDFQLVTESGDVTTLLSGTVEVKADVTRNSLKFSELGLS